MHAKGQWLRQAGFNTGGQITVKVMDGCLVLIPDSEATQQQHQQYQRQQAQLREIRQQMQALMTSPNRRHDVNTNPSPSPDNSTLSPCGYSRYPHTKGCSVPRVRIFILGDHPITSIEIG
ncbi:type I toxin-antitoxin system SymE family toxin [Photorhabdus heterorhabditis subsp. aluminescens]|nr:type I toxin-antitoxin system SymE family toxin [Photorhabdus heterorhabditis subsp. aluminescens]